MKKRNMALMLSFIFVISMISSSCSKPQPGNTAQPANDTQAAAKEEGYTLPIVKDGSVTLTYAGVDSYYPPASYTMNLPVWQEVEKRTGIKMKWEVSPSNQYAAAMQVRLAAGRDLPDVLMIPNGDVVKYADQGVLSPLDDLINKYAPNVKKKLQEYPILKQVFTAPDGHIYNLAFVTLETNELELLSSTIRKDWLDKLGLQPPATADEWYNVLKAFKERDPNGNGKADEIPIGSYEPRMDYGVLGNAFGLHLSFSDGWSVSKDGKVTYDRIQPNYKDYLTFLHKLFTDGLMDPMFSTNDQPKFEAMLSKNIIGSIGGAYGANVTIWNSILKKSGVDTGNYIQILPPKGQDGKAYIEKRWPTTNYLGITKSCKNPEAAIQWIDYIWASEEGNRLLMFGLEGKTYTMVDGKPKFTDFVLKNPDGLDAASALRSIGAWPSLFVWRKKMFDEQLQAPVTLEFSKTAASSLVESFPQILPSSEESRTITSVMADAQTYINEMQLKFVMGKEPMENYNRYVEQLKSIGIDKVIAIKQAQYDRVNKK